MRNLDKWHTHEDDEPSGPNPVAWFVLILTAEAVLGLIWIFRSSIWSLT